MRGRNLSAEDYRESLRRIVATSVQLGHALDDLLTLARTQGDQLHVYLVPIDAFWLMSGACPRTR